MYVLSFLFVVEIAVAIFILLIADRKYKKFINENKLDFQLLFMAPISLFIIDRLYLIERSYTIIERIHHSIIKLYQPKNGLAYTKMFIAQIISTLYIVMILITGVTLFNEADFTIFFFGIIFLPILGYGLIQQLEKKTKKREQQIILELPELLNKITLLVNAGETMQGAFIRAAEMMKDLENSPLNKELLFAVHELKFNRPFQQVMEDFNNRCGVQEVSIFTTTVLLNYRRGGSELILALRELGNILWEKRKSIVKTIGEEASSKLVFPMVFIFLVVMIIVAAPAIMFMNN